MKDFRTTLKVEPSKTKMDLKSRILTQGSCFADAIGARLARYKVKALVNPFGVIYNPESIHKVLSYSVFNQVPPDHTFLKNGDIHLNYNFHSEFASLQKEHLATNLANTIGSTHYYLKDTQWLLLTYGTAWVYHRKETGEIVANCHKMPGAGFSKTLLPLESIVSSFQAVFEQLKRFNPLIKVILTVSPVRHLKDTLELNAVSKSLLRLACYQLSALYDEVEYFPAYEIMLDDLRDYRFYKSDMLHPTGEAEDYIWEKFMERYFSPELKDFVDQWSIILAALRHKPFHPQSSSHQQFLHDTLKKLEEFRPYVDIEEERSVLKQQLITKQP